MSQFAGSVSIRLKPGAEPEFFRLLMPVIDAVRGNERWPFTIIRKVNCRRPAYIPYRRR
jgi:hypothetical protein